MRVSRTTTDDDDFKPYDITITVENAADEEMLDRFSATNVSVPEAVCALWRSPNHVTLRAGVRRFMLGIRQSLRTVPGCAAPSGPWTT